ncbi:hypothetical protein FO519_006024 [Halicephalobus sp. NKZ332]|nr:hypothetical protein FO519_006024 [Halicephalobus sp. NKZ332]
MSNQLAQQVEEQQKQLQHYERKLKDVVRAYKSLEAEKKALEVALEAVSSKDGGAEVPATESSSETKTEVTETEKIESLKQAIGTLTVENKKKELAFQADRKALLQKNEELQSQLDKLKSVSDSIGVQRKLKERLKQSELEKEKMLADHGAVLAEMQNREELENAKKQHAQDLSALTERFSRTSNLREDKDIRIASLEQRVQELTEESVQTIKEKTVLLGAIDELEKKLNFLMTESENLKKAQRRLSMEIDEDTSLEQKLAEAYSEILKLNPRFDVYGRFLT